MRFLFASSIAASVSRQKFARLSRSTMHSQERGLVLRQRAKADVSGIARDERLPQNSSNFPEEKIGRFLQGC
jgi:hypothetical protein